MTTTRMLDSLFGYVMSCLIGYHYAGLWGIAIATTIIHLVSSWIHDLTRKETLF